MEQSKNPSSIPSWFKASIRTIRPWLITLAIVLLLKFTGLLSGFSAVANSVVMKTGVMDFEPEKAELKEKPFNYNFSLRDLEGNVVDFNTFKGKVVFINLWATWCGPCRAEMPSIQKLYESVDKEKVAFVMLSLDAPDQEKKVVNYVTNKSFDFPVYMINNGLPEQLQVSSIPTTFILSKDGMIKSKKIGTANYDTDNFREYLKSLTTE